MILPLTSADVAARFNVDKGSASRWALAGEIRAQRTSSGYWLFDPADVDAFTPPQERAAAAGCAVDNCPRPHHALGFCSPHYRRHSRTGNVRPEVPVVRYGVGQRSPFDLDDTGEI
jgi:hypothetical protein